MSTDWTAHANTHPACSTAGAASGSRFCWAGVAQGPSAPLHAAKEVLELPLLQGLPLDGASGTVATYGLLLACMGLLISWAAPACNNPIFAEIVPPHLRTMIYAFDRSFESAIAASAAPLVGILAEKVFGWEVGPPNSQSFPCKTRPLHCASFIFVGFKPVVPCMP